MKSFKIIIKDKDNNHVETDIKSIDTDKNKLYLLSFITDNMDKEEIRYVSQSILSLLETKGVNNVVIVPVKDKEHFIDIKEIQIN